jgi:hypothetical protein
MTLLQDREPRPDRPVSLFAAFDSDLFVPIRAWSRVEAILKAKRGGNYGVTGPRGAGKTWLMNRAVSYARGNKGLGLWFPSPSEYNPMAFLAALSEVLAQEYIRDYLDRSPYGTEMRFRRRIRFVGFIYYTLFFGGFAVFFVGILRGFNRSTLKALTIEDLPFLNLLSVLGILLMVFGILILFFGLRFRRPRNPRDELYDRAVELRRKARFTTALKEAAEASASASAKGVSGALKRSSETALSERPATVSSMIHDFRSFCQGVASILEGPIVISIDELDKMESASAVAALLRDTKGIFDVPGVHFFVSISDEAARSLDLGAIQQRNEFNSSFYQVFDLLALTPEQSIDMFSRREVTVPAEVVLRLSIFAGGVPREVIRLADLALNPDDNMEIPSSPTLEITLLRQELLAFEQQVETVPREVGITDEDKVQSRSLRRLASDTELFIRSDFLSPNLWTPSWASDNWLESFGEPWRRLLVRLAIATALCENNRLDESKVAQLQEVASRNASSAAIGKALLEEYKQSASGLEAATRVRPAQNWRIELRKFLGLS